MAKKSDVNVAEEIRNYSKKFPDDGPKAVAEGLKKLGIETTPAYVSTIKNLDKEKQGKKKKVGGPRKSGGDLPYSTLAEAKELAKKLGGIDEARKALDALSKLVS